MLRGSRFSNRHTSWSTRRSQYAFKDSMIHGILQFTLRIAFRCVLHRCESQEIRCQKLFSHFKNVFLIQTDTRFKQKCLKESPLAGWPALTPLPPPGLKGGPRQKRENEARLFQNLCRPKKKTLARPSLAPRQTPSPNPNPLPREKGKRLKQGRELKATRQRQGKRCTKCGVGLASRRPSLFGNDPSAGSPTDTLLRLLLPLNDQV